MNIIYETTKERGATILIPSSMVDSLNPVATTLALALTGNAPAVPDAVIPPATPRQGVDSGAAQVGAPGSRGAGA